MKVKDLTIKQTKEICIKARTKPNGKIVNSCVENCPLNTRKPYDMFDKNLRACDIVSILNMEIEVE